VQIIAFVQGFFASPRVVDVIVDMLNPKPESSEIPQILGRCLQRP
jgi:hypothetical protein